MIHAFARARYGAVVVLLVGLSVVVGSASGLGAVPTTAKITAVAVDKVQHVAIFWFTASGPRSAFRCALAPSGQPAYLSSCKSPLSYDKLVPGVYEFTVQPVGPRGADATPATWILTVPIEFSRCWGAASRDPEHRCENPALSDVVVPAPANAVAAPVGFCNPDLGAPAISEPGDATTCAFGSAPAKARATIALIGDSHSTALRPALGYVATVEHWYGLSYEHNGCGFSKGIMLVPEAYANTCRVWSRAALAWLWQNREISTVVITGADERGWRNSAALGFHRLWRAIPPWVHRIFIVRDVPYETPGEAACVQSALALHQDAGTLCAQPRWAALTYDSEAAAASDSRSPRVHLIDLTPFFCSARLCFPVVGGALTNTDTGHMSPEFSVSLGPYLERSINAVK